MSKLFRNVRNKFITMSDLQRIKRILTFYEKRGICKESVCKIYRKIIAKKFAKQILFCNLAEQLPHHIIATNGIIQTPTMKPK